MKSITSRSSHGRRRRSSTPVQGGVFTQGTSVATVVCLEARPTGPQTCTRLRRAPTRSTLAPASRSDDRCGPAPTLLTPTDADGVSGQRDGRTSRSQASAVAIVLDHPRGTSALVRRPDQLQARGAVRRSRARQQPRSTVRTRRPCGNGSATAVRRWAPTRTGDRLPRSARLSATAAIAYTVAVTRAGGLRRLGGTSGTARRHRPRRRALPRSPGRRRSSSTDREGRSRSPRW